METQTESPWLSTGDLADYLGTSCDYVYRLVARREIPFHRPTGKIIFFHRDDVDAWLQRSRIRSKHELEEAAANHSTHRSARTELEAGAADHGKRR